MTIRKLAEMGLKYNDLPEREQRRYNAKVLKLNRVQRNALKWTIQRMEYSQRVSDGVFNIVTGKIDERMTKMGF